MQLTRNIYLPLKFVNELLRNAKSQTRPLFINLLMFRVLIENLKQTLKCLLTHTYSCIKNLYSYFSLWIDIDTYFNSPFESEFQWIRHKIHNNLFESLSIRVNFKIKFSKFKSKENRFSFCKNFKCVHYLCQKFFDTKGLVFKFKSSIFEFWQIQNVINKCQHHWYILINDLEFLDLKLVSIWIFEQKLNITSNWVQGVSKFMCHWGQQKFLSLFHCNYCFFLWYFSRVNKAIKYCMKSKPHYVLRIKNHA